MLKCKQEQLPKVPDPGQYCYILRNLWPFDYELSPSRAGDAAFNGRVLELPQVFSATGAEFGPDLRFSDLAVKRWGSVRIEFTACDRATFTWGSTGTDSARFGDGGYPLQRIFNNESTARLQYIKGERVARD